MQDDARYTICFPCVFNDRSLYQARRYNIFFPPVSLYGGRKSAMSLCLVLWRQAFRHMVQSVRGWIHCMLTNKICYCGVLFSLSTFGKPEGPVWVVPLVLLVGTVKSLYSSDDRTVSSKVITPSVRSVCLALSNI